MRTIRLKGPLGHKYGKVHKLDVRTPSEAVRALCANYPGLEQELMSSHERGVAYRCVVDNQRIDDEQLLYPMSKTFTITPVVHGGGKVFGIILGVVLIAAAIALAPVTGGTSLAAAMSTGIGFMGLTYGSIALLGAALLLGGIAQLLAPTPEVNQSSNQNNDNKYFDGPVNSIAQGSAVPVGYGRCIIGSAVISAGITIEEQSPPTYSEDYMIRGYGSNWNYA